MSSLTKGGKTTIATSLCHPDHRKKMAVLSNCRTEVTVDWTYDYNVEEIKLKDILLNYKGIFGTYIKENFTCEKFAEKLNSQESKYLKEVLKLKEQTGLSCEELEDYVKNSIRNYIDNCTDKELHEIIANRQTNQFIRRIKVEVPPVEEFKSFLQEITFVLRDTRGMLDVNLEETSKMPQITMQDLGIDEIDAVLVLGTSALLPNTVLWYKKAYKSAFESVPIFIMARSDALAVVYDWTYGIDDENVTPENVKEFLEAAKKGEEKGFTKFTNTFLPSYQLLEMYDIGTFNGMDFQYRYQVYDNKELCYFYPEFDLSKQNGTIQDYNSADYKLYELMIYENLKDMINKMIQHNNFVDAIYGKVKDNFNKYLRVQYENNRQNNIKTDMCPNYLKYDRSEVCSNIIDGDILGPYDGIVTVKHGNIKYLGAVTSGVTARELLRQYVKKYTKPVSEPDNIDEILKDQDGKDSFPGIKSENRRNLIRMALLNIIERSTDSKAYFQGYYFIDRYKVRDAITKFREQPQKDIDYALDDVCFKIAEIIFN